MKGKDWVNLLLDGIELVAAVLMFTRKPSGAGGVAGILRRMSGIVRRSR